MVLVALMLWAIAMTLLARLICRSWITHLSIYTFVWTISLGAYELHWIRYNSITGEAWLYIFVSWISLYAGSAIAAQSRRVLFSGDTPDAFHNLKLAIVLLTFGGLVSSIALAIEITREVDSNLLVAVTVGAPAIYQAAFEETGQFTGIPYLGFLPFAAAVLAGVYTARKGRIDWVSILPLLGGTILGILSVSRFDMLLCAALFVTAFCLSPKQTKLSLSYAQRTILAIVCLCGIVFVSLSRTDLVSALPEEQPTLTMISNWIPIAPSVYFYVSGPPIGFSEYLESSAREASPPWGRYAFASLYRFLSKLGLATYVPFHQEFYSTPEPVNTCTFLRELHSDFGVFGVFVVPGILGFVATRLSYNRGSLLALSLLTYIYIVILFSFTNFLAATGQWFQGLLACLGTSFLLDRAMRRKALVSRCKSQLVAS